MGIETENLEEPEARNKVMESKPTQRPTQRDAVGCGELRWDAV